jgi:DNA-binding CsgD family transcriptional regulator
MFVSKDHFVYKKIPEVLELTSKVYQDSGLVKFHNYIIQYDSGIFFELVTNIEWSENAYQKYVGKMEIARSRLKTGCNYWKQNNQQPLNTMMEDARDNFNIDARIEFVYRDEPNKCYHMYSFCSDRKNADRAYSFYGMHSAKLIKFISYFNRAASHIIAEANKPENLIIITDYTPPSSPEDKRHFVDEMKAVGASVNLGDRETEVMVLYAAGCSYAQIAEMFCRSPKTIENHIQHIKKKTGCTDRKDMNVYVRNLGLSGMERFFFSYFSHC